MRILRRYIAFGTLKGVALVMTVLVSVGLFIEFVGELDDIGTAGYTMAQALGYVALRIPRLVVDVLPAAALLGALLCLGNLAVHRELVVMRASGVSRFGLLGSVALAGFALLVIMIVLGESLGPSLAEYARELRTRALNEDLDLADGQSVWFKDGERIVSLKRPAGALDFNAGLFLFELKGTGLRRVARADSAEIDADSRWVLANFASTAFTEDGVIVQRERESRQSYNLSPELIDLSVVREDLLDTPSLRRYIEYLRANDLDASAYLLAFWTRMANAVSVVLMSVLALPFVFGGLRSAGTGGRMVVGLVIGLGYYVATQVLANTGAVFDIDPRIVAWAPVGVLALVTAIGLSRVR